MDNIRNNYLLEGHLPYNGNEIVLTSVEADNLDVTLGDIVNVKSMTDSGTVPYTVCGIDQKMNNTGKKALMSEEGVMHLNPEFKYETALIFLNDPSKAKEIKKQCQKNDIEFEMMSKLIIGIEANKNYTRGNMVTKAFDKVMNQGWLHFESIEKGLNNEN